MPLPDETTANSPSTDNELKRASNSSPRWHNIAETGRTFRIILHHNYPYYLYYQVHTVASYKYSIHHVNWTPRRDSPKTITWTWISYLPLDLSMGLITLHTPPMLSFPINFNIYFLALPRGQSDRVSLECCMRDQNTGKKGLRLQNASRAWVIVTAHQFHSFYQGHITRKNKLF